MDDPENQLESAEADLAALQEHNSRLTLITGLGLLAFGVVVLVVSIGFRLERLAVIGPVTGWLTLLSIFGSVVAIAIYFLNRRVRH